MKKAFVFLCILWGAVLFESRAQQIFPYEFEVGIRTVSLQFDGNINTIISNINPRIGVGIHLINPTTLRREGYNPPMLAKMAYGFFNFGHYFRGNDYRRQIFVDELGLGGSNSLFCVGYKINRIKSKEGDNMAWRLNNYFIEFSGNILSAREVSSENGSTQTTEVRSANSSTMNFNLCIGYQFGTIRRFGGRPFEDPKGRGAFFLSPQLHFYYITLPDGDTNLRQSFEREQLKLPEKDFAKWGVGGGIRLSYGFTLSNEMLFPTTAYVDFRYYIINSKALGPGFIAYTNGEFRPYIAVGITTSLNGGFGRDSRQYSGSILDRYKGKN